MRRYNNIVFNQGIGAEMMAERWKISRTELDAFSLESHRRRRAPRKKGGSATRSCRFRWDRKRPVHMTRDEGIRANSTLEKMATLKTAFKPDGVITAGNSSQISDGAAAVLIMERGAAEQLGLRPLARFVEFAMAAEDPVIMLSAPIPATRKILDRAGLTIDDIDRVEINEAFASVVLAWQREPARIWKR